MHRPAFPSTPHCAFWTFVLAAAATLHATAAPGIDWPEFRGPRGDGHANPSTTPTHWSETENVTWKTATPHKGWSTPVIADGKIWMTTATEDGHDFFVLCADALSGELIINKQLFHSDNPEPLGNNVNCYASPSPCAESGRVYVHFGSYGTACLDASNAEVIWQRTDLPCRHYRGPGSSPILFENLLILTFDGADQQYLTALNKNTGETVWRRDRSTAWQDLDENGQPKREGDFRKAFTTPLVFEAAGRTQLISPGTYTMFSYDARTGEEIWKGVHASYSPASRPLFGNGLVYACTGRGKGELWAIRPDGQGDITNSHIAWKLDGGIVPQEPSGVLIDDLLFLASDGGDATCVNALDGSILWSERLGGNCVASPILAGGHLYFCNVQGKTVVVKPGKSYEVIAENELEEGFMASPAVTGNALILRTKTHLYRIEAAGK